MVGQFVEQQVRVGPQPQHLSEAVRLGLGSLRDAEDVLQETLLAAWLGLGGFEGRSTVRTWLYRIATAHERANAPLLDATA